MTTISFVIPGRRAVLRAITRISGRSSGARERPEYEPGAAESVRSSFTIVGSSYSVLLRRFPSSSNRGCIRFRWYDRASNVRTTPLPYPVTANSSTQRQGVRTSKRTLASTSRFDRHREPDHVRIRPTSAPDSPTRQIGSSQRSRPVEPADRIPGLDELLDSYYSPPGPSLAPHWPRLRTPVLAHPTTSLSPLRWQLPHLLFSPHRAPPSAPALAIPSPLSNPLGHSLVTFSSLQLAESSHGYDQYGRS